MTNRLRAYRLPRAIFGPSTKCAYQPAGGPRHALANSDSDWVVRNGMSQKTYCACCWDAKEGKRLGLPSETLPIKGLHIIDPRQARQSA